MDFETQYRKTIRQSFEKYDEKNPQVYEWFKKFALQMIKRKGLLNTVGKPRKTSANLIINRIRWEIYMETKNEEGFRINNVYSAHYARKFVKEHPEYDSIFNFRPLRNQRDEL